MSWKRSNCVFCYYVSYITLLSKCMQCRHWYSPMLFDRYMDDHMTLWRHNGPDGVSNHQPHQCLLNCLFGRRWKKTSKLRVTGLCAWNSQGTVEIPAQMANNAENVSIWWRHHGCHRIRQVAVKDMTQLTIDEQWQDVTKQDVCT